MSEPKEASFDSQIASPKIRSTLIELARRKGVPENDREDIASATIADALRSKDKFDPTRATFATWIKAIGHNIIGTYHRRNSAKKRSAPGGIVSLQKAASEAESEFRDERHGKKQIEDEATLRDLMKKAKLSRKEDQAIASQWGHDNAVRGEFSPSTLHRAEQKLKQTGSDVKFFEHPTGPNDSECGYGKIPAAEQQTARLYDFLRGTLWFVNAVEQWRASPEWKDIQSYLISQRALRRFPLTVLSKNWPEDLHRYYLKANERSQQLRRRFEAAIDIVLAFPEWPTDSFCLLDPVKRRSRLEEFDWPFGMEPFWEITDRTFEIFEDFLRGQTSSATPPSDLSRFLDMINKAPPSGSGSFSSVHVIRVDWRFPPKSIAKSFEKWVTAQKKEKRDISRVQPSGRPKTELLVGYAFHRLTSEFGMKPKPAFSWLKKYYGAPVPTSPERLKRIAKQARDALKDFLPAPAEIGV
jgi:hypothetical protein